LMVLKQATPAATAIMSENLPGAIGAGAFIVTEDAGRIYRVGVRRTELDDATHEAWELQGGSDMHDALTENVTADRPAWCIGRERLANGAFIGPAQDVSIFTTQIQVKP